MEVSTSMLVALMFVTILTLGIANILASLAAVVGKAPGGEWGRLQVSWKLFVLLIHFALFWHTLDLLTVAEWQFVEFLYVISGPVLIFFATSTLLAAPAPPPAGETGVPARFFGFLAALQAWTIGVDVLFAGGMTTGDAFAAALFVLFTLLAVRRERRLHLAGSAIAWIVALALVGLRGANVIT